MGATHNVTLTFLSVNINPIKTLRVEFEHHFPLREHKPTNVLTGVWARGPSSRCRELTSSPSRECMIGGVAEKPVSQRTVQGLEGAGKLCFYLGSLISEQNANIALLSFLYSSQHSST